ncbi:peptidase M20 [Halalkalibacillus sediminis]|uniref:Peptidase M20 n=1 Tax=Halalkalibacillus sediminis TaxID=2018042 RepID=A0A2I0QU85_9BACI|nr:amidohydrolase [Halalkalibacillus sediminis]PKR77869.1 peptidase M20 [Halalkalibacillus sediminis]
MSSKIARFIDDNEEKLVQQRRLFHQHPEVGFTEYITTYEIYHFLRGMDCDLAIGKSVLSSDERMGVPASDLLELSEQRAKAYGVPEEFLEKIKGGHTGAVATFDTGRKGSHIALRFDIDALPVKEAGSSGHIPKNEGFNSCHNGEMHACAHDGHASIGLMVAKFLNENMDDLSGKFTLIFQPAEEGGRGAEPIVSNGWLDNVDYFFSGHIGVEDLPVGKVSATTAGFLASSKVDAYFIGKAAHAGLEPNAGKNALLAASASSIHLNGIARHKDGSTRINVGKIEAGSGRNVIADSGKIEFETRGSTSELDDYMMSEAERIIHSTAGLYGVESSLETVGKALNVSCDDDLIEVVRDSVKESSLIDEVRDVANLGASEDVTFMIEKVQKEHGKATFMVFHSPLKAGHHQSDFNFDEKVLSVGLETYLSVLTHLNNKESSSS